MSSTSSESGQTSAEKPRSSFAYSKSPWTDHGPETVVNPSQQELASGVRQPGLPASSNSELINRLFPPEMPPEGSGVLEEPDGIQLGHFEIESRIGTGGMGSVFKAHDTRLQRTVALKILTPGQSRDPSSVQRFQNEAQAAARLDHENVARVFYFGEDQGLHFIAYEFITGTNVRERIRQKGKLHPGEAVNYTLQIASALNHTSSVGVVHRDIKPSNIIITPSGRAKLVDLGLARKQSLDNSDELTTVGTTLGTFDYIAPEQAKDPRNVDVRSDIYSLGCTLYHMLTGEPPYPEGTVLQKLLDHQGTDPPNPCKRNRNVPPELGTVVQKMMASDPRRRYSTPDDLIRDLMPFVGTMVLRDLGPAGLVWASSEPKNSRFWERNLGWMATSVVLLLIVLFISRYPAGIDFAESIGFRSSPPSPENSRIETEPPTGTTTNEGIGGEKAVPDSQGGHSTAGNNQKPNSVAAKNDNSPTPKVLGGDPAVQPYSTKAFTEPDEKTASKSESTETEPEAVAVVPPPVEATKPTDLVAERPQPAVSIKTSSGDVKSYLTLEAACSDARDGDVIELNYNGRLIVSADKPLKIANKEIIVSAGRDRNGKRYRPLIEFVPGSNSLAEDVRMLSLIDGNVNFINVDLKMNLGAERDMGSYGKWTFFESHGSDSVRLKNVGLTVINPRPENRRAAVFELGTPPASSRNSNMMKNGDQADNRGFYLEITGSFLRGGCDLFSSRFARHGRIEIKNSVVALERSLLSLKGDEEEAPAENAQLELQLDHVTCLTGNGLIDVHSGSDELTGSLIPLVVSARNNLFAAGTVSPMVSMTGKTDPQDFQRMLRLWEGSRNYYGSFDFFWLIRQDPSAEPDLALDLRGWKKRWGRADADFDAAVVWDRQERWLQKPFSQLTVVDVELNPDPELNPAALGADDGSDAGADLAHFHSAAENFNEAILRSLPE